MVVVDKAHGGGAVLRTALSQLFGFQAVAQQVAEGLAARAVLVALGPLVELVGKLVVEREGNAAHGDFRQREMPAQYS